MKTISEFDALPAEVKVKISQNLSIRDLVNLAMTSKQQLTLFKPIIKMRDFLKAVTLVEHDAVEKLLKEDINLIFKRGTVTDCSGRKFDKISGFEYALWALDKHILNTMIDCIPNSEEGKEVFAKLLSQYKKVNTYGVTYEFKHKTITENNFDFENTIIKELQKLVELFASSDNEQARDKQWQQGVGGAQKLLPMHVVNEYCSDKLFNEGNIFDSKPKPSANAKSLKHFLFITTISSHAEYWFKVDSKLSHDFAIDKCGYVNYDELLSDTNNKSGVYGYAAAVESPPSSNKLSCVLSAIQKLYTTRKKDLANLNEKLENRIMSDNNRQLS